MAVVRYGLALLGLALCLWGAHQVRLGIPDHVHARAIADLQADANRILLGIAWQIGGIACGVLALAFSPASLARGDGLSPDPSGG